MSYIEFGEKPPNWYSLVTDTSEKVTNEQYNTALTWYSPDSKLPSHDNTLTAGINDHKMREDSSSEMREDICDTEPIKHSNCSNGQMREDFSGEMRENNKIKSHKDSDKSHPTTPQPFVDLSSLGLRR